MSIPSKKDFCEEMCASATDGRLMYGRYGKHMPDSLSAAEPRDRTVIAQEILPIIPDMFKNEKCDIWWYTDTNSAHNSDYVVVAPDSSLNQDFVASAVPGGSMNPSGTVDRFVLVRYNNGDWHMFGEDSSVIDNNTDLTNKTELK